MRTFVFVVGFVMILGGIAAGRSPEDFVMHTVGYDPATVTVDHVSKKRAVVTGYATIVVGFAACAFGYFMKDLKTPDSHDNPA